jgi:3-oxoadipate enol-lactonase / 4-carboxymuconolactone decarboxylase
VPFVTTDNTRLFYRLEGIEGRPVLVLSASIGTDSEIWAQQVPDLLPYFQLLRYDTRGLGASDAPSGDYSIERLGRDVLALVEALHISKFAFCGLSLGGMIGQWLGVNAPDRVTALVLANTSPLVTAKSSWEDRRRAVLEGGMAAIADMALERFFSPETLATSDPYVSSVRATLLGTDPVGYAGCCAAIRDMDHTALLGRIKVPTMVISGDRDLATPWSGHGERLAREIPGAKAVRLMAAHLSNIERPRSFTAALLDFLRPQPAAPPDPLEAGMAVRRAVLGDAHVDRSMFQATEFTRDFQTMITRYAWGTVWTRPGLDRRTRRLLVLMTTAALGRWEEFRMHLRAALAHGLEECDVKEVLLQAAIYAGVPVANTGFHIAAEELQSAQGHP